MYTIDQLQHSDRRKLAYPLLMTLITVGTSKKLYKHYRHLTHNDVALLKQIIDEHFNQSIQTITDSEREDIVLHDPDYIGDDDR